MKEMRPENIRDLWELCREQTEEEFLLWGADLVYEYPPDLEQMQTSVRERKDTCFFKMEGEEGIVGFAELKDIQPDGQRATLARLILAPEFRRQGLGRRAVKEILELARERWNISEAELVVYQKNVAARHCYENCGFVIEKPLIRRGRPDAWIMKAKLR